MTIEGGEPTTGPDEQEAVPDVAPPIDLKADPAGTGRGAARRWLLAGLHATSSSPHHPTYPWWKVMCLTGVDYFSTLGYQPGIAFLAAGMLSPAATLVLILVTLFVALPIYAQVAAHSPHGQGSILMLEQLLPRWYGKAFVLLLVALREVLQHPSVLSDWRTALFAEHGSPLRMLGVSMLLFPKLALGLSGFETGVAVMPLVRGGPDDTPQSPRGRIRNTKKCC